MLKFLAISAQLQSGEEPTITRILIAVNVPFVGFKEYWDDMKAKGLISAELEIGLTKEGERYLEEHQKVKEFLEEFRFIREEREGWKLPLQCGKWLTIQS